jgi:uncharacterized phiE125 gp8 family phage protein
LAEVKDVMRVDGMAEDALIESLIGAATRRYDGEDGWLGRALVEQSWEYRLDSFPRGAIEVPLPPLRSVDSVTYEARDGTTATLAEGADFRVDTRSEPGRVVPVGDWPRTADVPGAVTLAFTAGYPPGAGSPPDYGANVPEPLRTAIMQTVAAWYEARMAVTVDADAKPVPRTGDALAREYKVAWVF